MVDLTLMTGTMYYDNDAPIKNLVVLMKDAIGTAEEKTKRVIKQFKQKKAEWSKVFLHYPQHAI